MILKGEKLVRYIKYGKIAVNYFTQGVQVIYNAIVSVFGNGYWQDDADWDNEDCWKNL